VHLEMDGDRNVTVGGGVGMLQVPFTKGARATAGVTILLTVEWSDEVRSTMLREVYGR